MSPDWPDGIRRSEGEVHAGSPRAGSLPRLRAGHRHLPAGGHEWPPGGGKVRRYRGPKTSMRAAPGARVMAGRHQRAEVAHLAGCGQADLKTGQ
jgi:hypothetical protein